MGIQHNIPTCQDWSKAALASEFNLDRKTISKIVGDAVSCGVDKKGYPVYRLIDVVPRIGAYLSGFELSDSNDPEQMGPKDRKDWYDGEARRLQVAETMRHLIPDDEFTEIFGIALKSMTLTMTTFTDVLERDAALTPEQAAKAQKMCAEMMDSLRHNLTAALEPAETTEAA